MTIQAMNQSRSFKWLLVLILSFLTIFTTLIYREQAPTARADGELPIRVNVPALNVRALPSINSKIVSVVHRGDTFKVTQSNEEWDRIELLDTQSGWVKKEYVQPITGNTLFMVESTVKGLNVHQSADLQSPIVSHIAPGKTYLVINLNNFLVQIESPNGPGWVTKQFVKETLIEENSGIKDATVNVNSLHIREFPDATSSILGFLHQKDLVHIQVENQGWAKITTPNGRSGWVAANFLNVMKDRSVQNPTQKQKKETTSSSNSAGTMKVQSLPPNSDVLKNKTIVIDPGHGGKDDGTTSIIGTPEKTLTLKTAEAVASRLSAAGAHVILTRTEDTYVSLDDRVNLSEKEQADAFISFHYNASVLPFIKGVTSYYYTKSKDETLASDLVSSISDHTGISSRGARYNDLHVLRENTQPATLIELGFVSNKGEDQTVETDAFRTEVAEGVYKGLIDYFSSVH